MLRVLQVRCYLFLCYGIAMHNCAYAQTLRVSYKQHHVWQLFYAHAQCSLLVILRYPTFTCLIMGRTWQRNASSASSQECVHNVVQVSCYYGGINKQFLVCDSYMIYVPVSQLALSGSASRLCETKRTIAINSSEMSKPFLLEGIKAGCFSAQGMPAQFATRHNMAWYVAATAVPRCCLCSLPEHGCISQLYL